MNAPLFPTSVVPAGPIAASRGACNPRGVKSAFPVHAAGPGSRRCIRAASLACLAGLAFAAGAQSPEPTHSPVATGPSPADLAAPAAAPAATLDSVAAFREFRQRFDAAQYEAALPYAQRVLELAGQVAKQPAAEEVQVALMNVAMTQYLVGDYVATEASYLRAIELIESSGRPLQTRLARAYAGLASAYHEGNRHDLAVRNFEKALGLTRRDEGLLTERQVPLLEKYVDSLTELGRYEEALKAQQYVLRIATRKYGANGAGLAPTLEQIGRWHAEVGAYDQARRLLKRAIALVEAAEGDQSAHLVSLLASLAACDRKQLLDPNQQLLSAQDPDRAAMFHEPGVATATYSPAMLMSEAEKSLQRACAIAEEGPEPSPVQIADVRTQLGDWYQGRGQPERARPNYRKAWTAAERATGRFHGKPLVDALFGQPVLLHIVRPDDWKKYAGRPPEQVEVRNVIVEFTVNTEGRAESLKVVDDTDDGRRAAKTADSIEDTARYRPRLEKGEPVATPEVRFTQPWIVLLPGAPGAPEAEKKTPAETPPAQPPQATAPAAAVPSPPTARARRPA